MDEDPFALPDIRTARDQILSRGRYMLPWKDGSHKSRGFMRVSNLVSAYSDQFGLRMWELGEVLQGVASSAELYATLLAARLDQMSREQRKAWVEDFIEHAKEASGGNFGSKHGMQRHAAVEGHHMGLPAAHHDAGTRRHLSLYADALERNNLRALPHMQERRVLVEELEVVGTLDNVLTDPWGAHLIGDLKTQRRFWTWLEIKAQLACYAHGDAMWNAETGAWEDMPPVSQDVAMVLWMPRVDAGEEPHVDVWEVDIRAGWETAKRAYEVVKDRALAKSVAPGAWLRAAPPASDFERFTARFAACDSLADGRRLVAEAQEAGVWDKAMAKVAQEARDRIAVKA
jgi:hypothetical protein